MTLFKHDNKLLQAFKNEIAIMETINNPRILRLVDKLRIDNLVYLITVYCEGGNLEDFILKQNPTGIPEKDAIKILR